MFSLRRNIWVFKFAFLGKFLANDRIVREILLLTDLQVRRSSGSEGQGGQRGQRGQEGQAGSSRVKQGQTGQRFRNWNWLASLQFMKICVFGFEVWRILKRPSVLVYFKSSLKADLKMTHTWCTALQRPLCRFHESCAFQNPDQI